MSIVDNQTRINRLTKEGFQRKYGVNRETFDAMLSVLQAAYETEHAQGGRPPKLTVTDRLSIFLMYYREYRTMENIAIDYGVANSTVCTAISWTEKTLMNSGQFSLPSKRGLLADVPPEVVVIDVTECETERPKKNSEKHIPARKRSIQSKFSS